jgi:hypothetical protein
MTLGAEQTKAKLNSVYLLNKNVKNKEKFKNDISATNNFE